MEMQKVVFMNKELNLRLAGLLYLPTDFDLRKNYPAVVVTGPMLSVKEQAQSVYAKRLTEAGYVTLVFDGAYFGESEGMPRGQELPDVKLRVRWITSQACHMWIMSVSADSVYAVQVRICPWQV